MTEAQVITTACSIGGVMAAVIAMLFKIVTSSGQDTQRRLDDSASKVSRQQEEIKELSLKYGRLDGYINGVEKTCTQVLQEIREALKDK